MPSSEQKRQKLLNELKRQQLLAALQEDSEQGLDKVDVAQDLARAPVRGARSGLEFMGEVAAGAGEYGPLKFAAQIANKVPQARPLGRALETVSELPKQGLEVGRKLLRGATDPLLEYEIPAGESRALDAGRFGLEVLGGGAAPGGALKSVAKASGISGGLGAGGYALGDTIGKGEEVGTAAAFLPMLPSALKALGARFKSTDEKTAEFLNDLNDKSPIDVDKVRSGKGSLGVRLQSPTVRGAEETLKSAKDSSGFKNRIEEVNQQVVDDTLGTIQGSPATAEQMAAPRKSALAETQRQLLENQRKSTRNLGRVERAGTSLAESTRKARAKELEDLRLSQGQSKEQWNLERLNEVSPKGFQVTKVGKEGAQQNQKAFESEYGRAWGMASEVPPETAKTIRKIIKNTPATAPGDKEQLKKIGKMLKDVEKEPTAEKMLALDRSMRSVIRRATSGTNTNYTLMEDVEDIREAYRRGLPKEAQDLISDLDSRYGGHLAARRAAYKSANDGYVFDENSLLSEAQKFSGETRWMTDRGIMQEPIEKALGTSSRNQEAVAAAESRLAQQPKAVELRQNEITKALRDQAKTRQSAIEQGTVSKFAEAENPDRAIQKVMGSDNPTQQLKELKAVMGENPEAMAGLQSAARRNVFDMVTTDQEVWKPTRSSKFNRVKEPLTELLGQDEVQQIERSIDEANSIFNKAGISRVDINEPEKGMMYLLARMGGARVLSGVFGANPLIAANYGSNLARKRFHDIPHKKVIARLQDVLANPDKPENIRLIENMQNIRTEAQATNLLNYLTAAGSTTTDEE